MAKFDFEKFEKDLAAAIDKADDWLADNGGTPTGDRVSTSAEEAETVLSATTSRELGKDALTGFGSQSELVNSEAA